MPSSHQVPPSNQSSTIHFHNDQVRQHHSSIPHQQTGLEQEHSSQRPVGRNTQSLPQKRLDSPCSSHPRTPQHMGGFTIQKPHHQGGMGPDPSLIQENNEEPQSSDRLICSPRQQQTTDIRLPISSPSRDCSRCDVGQLESVVSNISLPTNRPHSGVPPEVATVRRQGHLRGASQPRRSMVASVRRALLTIRQRARGFPMGTRQTRIAARNDVLELSRIQFLTKVFSNKFPASVANTLITSHRKSTTAQYEHSWKDFQSWLRGEDILVTKGSILQYLVHLSSVRKLNPKTILVYRNALQLPLLHGFNINTKDPEFSLIARSQFIENPPRQRIIPNWKLSKVLSLLEQPQYENKRASPGNLLMKSLFLVALATGNRVSELAAMSRGSTTFSPKFTSVVIPVKPGFLYKNQSMFKTPPNITIKALFNEDKSHHRLCPVDALRHWLRLSEPWGSDTIFINPKSKKPMNSGSISSYLVHTINAAIPKTFAKAHDLRKISASLAWVRGIPPHEIVRSLFWNNSSTFIRKYLVPLKDRPVNCVAAGSSI